jgi:hypothetical protein
MWHPKFFAKTSSISSTDLLPTFLLRGLQGMGFCMDRHVNIKKLWPGFRYVNIHIVEFSEPATTTPPPSNSQYVVDVSVLIGHEIIL